MIEKEKINPTATGTEVPSYGLFSALSGKAMGKALGQRGGLFDQARQNSMNTFGTAPKLGSGGGIFNFMKGKIADNILGIAKQPTPAPSPSGGGLFSWMKKKVSNDLNDQGTFKAPLPFGGSAEVRIPTPQPAPQPAPAQKTYRDFDWSDYNADRQTMDVDERDQYYDNYKRDRDFWGNYYNRQPYMPEPMRSPYATRPSGNYVTDRGGMSYTDMDTGINYESGTGPRDQRMEQDRMIADNMGELTVMPKDYGRPEMGRLMPMPQRQGFFGRPMRREPSYGGFGGALRSLLGGLIGGGLGSIMPRPRGGLGGLFGGMGYRPQPAPPRNFFGGLGSLFGRF